MLEEAVELVDQEGLEALSMRALGRRLGVEAMSLYNHVANKEALLDGIVEVVLEDVRSDADDWRDALREIGRGYREAARSHPEVMQLFASRRFESPPWARVTNDTLAAFHRAGFPPEEAVHGYRIVSSYLTGYVFGELRLRDAPTIGEYLDQIDPEHYPVLHDHGEALAALDRDREYQLGLELIIDELERRLLPHATG